jgi:hypothetical protein
MKTKMMKRKIGLSVLLASVVSTAAMGQYFNGGLFFGFTMAQIDGDTYSGFHQPGLTAGAFTSRDFGEKVAAQLEIKYTAKGARETGNDEGPVEYEQRLRYIEVPVKFIYKINPINMSLEAGLVPGYLFQHKGLFDLVELDSDYEKFELSWLAGINYHLSEKVSLSIHYSYSIVPVRKYENSGYNYGFLSRTFWLTRGDYNNVVQFMVYYQMGK